MPIFSDAFHLLIGIVAKFFAIVAIVLFWLTAFCFFMQCGPMKILFYSFLVAVLFEWITIFIGIILMRDN